METTALTEALDATRVARYSSPVPGYGTGSLPVRILGDERPAVFVLAVPAASDCPRCQEVTATGGAAAAILADAFGGDCMAPYTHSLPL